MSDDLEEFEDTEDSEELEDYQDNVDDYILDIDDKQVKLKKDDIHNLYKNYYNDKKWKDSNRRKSEEINKLRESLESEKKELEDRRKKVISREKEIEARYQQNRVYSEAEKKKIEAECQLAIAEAVKNWDDFNYDKITEFAKRFNEDDPRDKLKLLYYAERGSRLEEYIEEARAKLVRESMKKKGLPPVGVDYKPVEKLTTKQALINRLKGL